MKILRVFKYLLVVIVTALCCYAIAKIGQNSGESPVKNSSTLLKESINNIGELATAEYSYTQLGKEHKDKLKLIGIKIPFTQSEVVYTYDGVIKAGINCENVNISVNELTKKITVKLPKATILDNDVDENSLNVISDNSSMLNPIKFEDFGKSLAEFEEEAQNNAISKGLLDKATENAQNIITSSISSFYDTEKYQVVFKIIEESDTDSDADEATTNSEAA